MVGATLILTLGTTTVIFYRISALSTRDLSSERNQAEVWFRGSSRNQQVDVLLLKIKAPGAAGLVTTKGGTPSWSFPNPEKKVEIKNQSLAGIAGCFGSQLKMLVYDRTELSGRYDCSFRWQNRNGEADTDAIKRIVLEQFGLEFVPARESVKMLVVERVKE